MLEGFTKISLSKSGLPILSVTNNGLLFNGNVVSRMQNAILLVNADKKQIAIQKCDESETDKISFVRNGARINYRDIRNLIARMMNWNLEDYTYRVTGFYLVSEQAIIFDLKNASKKRRRRQRDTD